jgi:hypothetical protein
VASEYYSCSADRFDPNRVQDYESRKLRTVIANSGSLLSQTATVPVTLSLRAVGLETVIVDAVRVSCGTILSQTYRLVRHAANSGFESGTGPDLWSHPSFSCPSVYVSPASTLSEIVLPHPLVLAPGEHIDLSLFGSANPHTKFYTDPDGMQPGQGRHAGDPTGPLYRQRQLLEREGGHARCRDCVPRHAPSHCGPAHHGTGCGLACGRYSFFFSIEFFEISTHCIYRRPNHRLCVAGIGDWDEDD